MCKVIAVTGAASGISLATAKVLFARGVSLSLTDIREDALNKAVAAIKETLTPSNSPYSSPASSIITTAIDLRQSSQVDSWIGKPVSHFRKLDGAANIAGVLGKNFGVHDLSQLSNEEGDFVTSTNLTAIFYCMRAQINALSQGGCIVNASSATGLERRLKNSAYLATKNAVIDLSKSAAGEVGARGIRINCVAPGLFNTPIVTGLG
ncbi:hypothetical protein OEA41_005721 [Lepraria neglecta]|uniref:NAD(P)-binding protein n=1 Tax=Lepraria neglecta TaxID=209136 RepID=A0AAD9Z6D6_9LECA|nr:hypothetical protein OEA41_005721 [Lepraria neglecta]